MADKCDRNMNSWPRSGILISVRIIEFTMTVIVIVNFVKEIYQQRTLSSDIQFVLAGKLFV